MKRVATLIEKLRELLQQGASAEKLMFTTQMLQAELQKFKTPGAVNGGTKVAVIMPASFKVVNNPEENKPENKPRAL